MAEDQDESQKTEDPTSKKLEDARQRGQTATSREVSSFMMLLAFTFFVAWLAPGAARDTVTFFSVFIQEPQDFPLDEGNLGGIMSRTIQELLLILMLPVGITVIAALGASLMQNRINFSFEPIKPDLEKISPLKGLKRMFSLRSLMEMVKGIIKLIIVGYVAYASVKPYLPRIKQLPDTDLMSTLFFTSDSIERMLIGICVAMFFIALFDYLYQRFEYIKGLRMTKQEVRDEYKQQEGDPVIKQRLRAIRMERARKRMMAAVPKADVVITNPTHYSVALSYDSAKMKAPKVVAKGIDKVALRIREVAEKHDIPIVENPPLARALYETELDEEIALEHYKAVAEVIGYVYRLKGKAKRRMN